VNTVDGQVEGCEATGEEAPPPPVVVFSTEVEIAEKDGGLRAGDDQDDEDKKQKSIHVIDLTGPDAVEDKEELDEDASKGENTTHNDARNGLSVNRLVRYLSRDLVGPDWLFNCWFSEPKISPNKGEGDRHSKPKSQEGNQSEERNGCRGGIVPEDKVQNEEMSKDDTRTQHRGQ